MKLFCIRVDGTWSLITVLQILKGAFIVFRKISYSTGLHYIHSLEQARRCYIKNSFLLRIETESTHSKLSRLPEIVTIWWSLETWRLGSWPMCSPNGNNLHSWKKHKSPQYPFSDLESNLFQWFFLVIWPHQTELTKTLALLNLGWAKVL